jgi:hypothetical protein
MEKIADMQKARRYKVEGNLARTVELARTLLQDPELSQYRRAVVNFLMIGTIPPNEIISFDEQLSYIAECHDAMMLWLDSGVTSSVETTAIYMISQLKMRVSQAIREIIRIEVVNGSRVPFEEKQLSGEGCFSDLDYAPPEWEWVALTLNSNTTEPINLWDQYVSRLLELDRNLTVGVWDEASNVMILGLTFLLETFQSCCGIEERKTWRRGKVTEIFQGGNRACAGLNPRGMKAAGRKGRAKSDT